MTARHLAPVPNHDAEPCIVCGAPITGNAGHDEGCMAIAPAGQLDVESARARVRALAETERTTGDRHAEAKLATSYALKDAVTAGATLGELATDAQISRAYVHRRASDAWRREGVTS